MLAAPMSAPPTEEMPTQRWKVFLPFSSQVTLLLSVSLTMIIIDRFQRLTDPFTVRAQLVRRFEPPDD